MLALMTGLRAALPRSPSAAPALLGFEVLIPPLRLSRSALAMNTSLSAAEPAARPRAGVHCQRGPGQPRGGPTHRVPAGLGQACWPKRMPWPVLHGHQHAVRRGRPSSRSCSHRAGRDGHHGPAQPRVQQAPAALNPSRLGQLTQLTQLGRLYVMLCTAIVTITTSPRAAAQLVVGAHSCLPAAQTGAHLLCIACHCMPPRSRDGGIEWAGSMRGPALWLRTQA